MGTANSKYCCYFLTQHYHYCKLSSQFHFVPLSKERGNVFIYLIPFMFKALKYSVRMTLR